MLQSLLLKRLWSFDIKFTKYLNITARNIYGGQIIMSYKIRWANLIVCSAALSGLRNSGHDGRMGILLKIICGIIELFGDLVILKVLVLKLSVFNSI